MPSVVMVLDTSSPMTAPRPVSRASEYSPPLSLSRRNREQRRRVLGNGGCFLFVRLCCACHELVVAVRHSVKLARHTCITWTSLADYSDQDAVLASASSTKLLCAVIFI